MAQSLWNRVARDGEGVRFGKCSRILAELTGGQADCTIGLRMPECTRPLALII